MHPEYSFWIVQNLSQIRKIKITLQLTKIKLSSDFFDVLLFLLITGSRFKSISLLVLELRQISFRGLTRSPEIANTSV